MNDKTIPWKELLEKADEVVVKTISELPEDLKAHAQRIPCLLEKYPPNGSRNILGTYHGFIPKRVSEQHGPIFLFLGPLWRHSDESGEGFEILVRKTWLHEFGHYLGWDEEDLKARGLG